MESRQLADEYKQAFAKLFPLAREGDLPWAPCQVERFLKRRIERAVDENTQGFANEVFRILMVAAHPASSVLDMARNQVSELLVLRQFRDSILADVNVNLDKMKHADYQHPHPDELMRFLDRWRKEAVNTLED